jgi:hypothetical protein
MLDVDTKTHLSAALTVLNIKNLPAQDETGLREHATDVKSIKHVITRSLFIRLTRQIKNIVNFL